MSGKKRRWTAEEKLRIVLTGVRGDVEISELCRREGINLTQYYGWRKQLLGSAAEVFSLEQGRPSTKEQRLAEENRRLKSVVAEIAADNLELKKGSWFRGSRADAGGIAGGSDGRRRADAAAQWLVGPAYAEALGVSPARYWRWRCAAGAALRGARRGEKGGVSVCIEASGIAPLGVGLAHGGRGNSVAGALRWFTVFTHLPGSFAPGAGGRSLPVPATSAKRRTASCGNEPYRWRHWPPGETVA